MPRFRRPRRRRTRRSKLVSTIKKVISKQAEKKFSIDSLTTSVDNGGDLIPLFQDINQGDSARQRLGNEIRVLGGVMTWKLSNSQDDGSNTPLSSLTWRVMVLSTRNPVSTVSELFNDFGSLGMVAPIDRDVVSVVHMNRYYTISANAFDSSTNTPLDKRRLVNRRINLRNMKVKYDTGDPTTCQRNTYMVIINDNPANPVFYNWQFKNYFTDL